MKQFKTLSLIACTIVASQMFAQVGIGTEEPTSTLDVNGDLRVRDIPTSISTNDFPLVTDATGVVKKGISETKGIFRGYLSSNFTSENPNSIYKVMNWTEIDDPHNDFNTTTGLFTAPETGLYKITFTGTFLSTSSTYPGYVCGFASEETGQWIMRFTISDNDIEEASSTGGVANTFVGVVSLEAGKSYYFGISRNITLLSNPTGYTGTGIGTYFEVQLIKN